MAWRIRIFGVLEVERDGRAVALGGLRQRERALLAILALRRSDVVLREELAETVFGHLAPERVAANLRVALSRLRTTLGDPAIIESRDGGHRLAETVGVDVTEFEAHADRGRTALREGHAETARVELEAALDLYRSDIGALDVSIEWEAPLRARLRGQRVEAFEDLADAYLALARPRDASAVLERAIELDRTRESAYRRLMTAHYAAGEQDAALRAYERCRNALDEELGVDPLPESMALHERILRRDPVAIPGARTPAPVRGALPFVARHAERIVLESVIARAGREGVLVLVVGEPGAGKTRLVTETLALRTDVSVMATRCYELESDLPFQPLRDALGDRAPSALADVAPDRARAALIEAYARAVLAQGHGRPLVWSIDDVQWADRSTLDVLHFIARRSANERVAIVAAGRDDALPPEHPVMRLLTDLRREGRAERVALTPLAAGDIAILARAGGLPVERAEAIRARSGGNAFFATELLIAMRRGSSELPETARDAVLARSHALDPEARRALEAAAVLGGRFQTREIAGLAQLNDETAARALGSLESHDFVRSLPRGEQELVHDLVREAVYGDIPAAVRSELHTRAIAVLEAERGEDGASLICYHAERAGDADCAFACAVFTGERALTDQAGTEALASFDRALRQPVDAESRSRCLTLRAQAKRQLGLADEAAADLAAADALR